MLERYWSLLVGAAVGGVLLVPLGCGGGSSATGPGAGAAKLRWEEARSDKERDSKPSVEPNDLAALVGGNTAFALNLYQALREQEGNLFCSPYSISLALAMTWAGTRGDTEAQIAKALQFGLGQDKLHPAFNALDLMLPRSDEAAKSKEAKEFRLNIANALWGQQGFAFLPAFLDVLAENYGAGLQLLDFAKSPESSRTTLNQWVSDETEEKIKDLFPQGSITDATRLVLANAIYFNAPWSLPFEKDLTRDGAFTLLDGNDVSVPMMREIELLAQVQTEGLTAVELPYKGNQFSMVILLPDAGQYEAYEKSLNPERVAALLEALKVANVHLTLPKFTFSSTFNLKSVLTSLGMEDAFAPGAADLSGMNGKQDLFVSDVVHKAFVKVDEEGTEAAAATGVVVGITSVPADPIEITVDRPFLFLIRHRESGTLLFVGRVLNPAV